MAYQTFAAIDVGSNDVSMKIYQISMSTGIKQLDYVSQFLALGKDTYRTGKVGYELVDQLCHVLTGFKSKMKEYKVKNYVAYATSAIREAGNREVILNQILLKTGLKVEVLSNSEHRFLMYKGIASRTSDFNQIIQKNTAILDMGAGSVQISIFDKQKLAFTQNIRIGALRIQELIGGQQERINTYKEMLQEYISNELETFLAIHLKEKDVKNIIAVGDEIIAMKKVAPELDLKTSISNKQLDYIYHKIEMKKPQQLSIEYGIDQEVARLLLTAAMIYKIFLERTQAEIIWAPGIDLCDSIAADYGDTTKKVILDHDFQEDIIASSKRLAKRFRCNKEHINVVTDISLEIFDRIKKMHGLGSRERLLLEIASILHDCGKFVNMNAGGVNAYNIIMAAEFIGLSHRERQLVALIVKHNTNWLPSYDRLDAGISKEDYIMVCKLTAILRIANALDRSHKQKVKGVSVSIKDRELWLRTDSMEDISLETTLFQNKADYFEEVYGIRPVIKQRRKI